MSNTPQVLDSIQIHGLAVVEYGERLTGLLGKPHPAFVRTGVVTVGNQLLDRLAGIGIELRGNVPDNVVADVHLDLALRGGTRPRLTALSIFATPHPLGDLGKILTLLP